MEIIAVATGKVVVPDTSQGPNFSIDENFNMKISAHTLPSADNIFLPVFVTSRELAGDMIKYLLKSTQAAALAKAEDAEEPHKDPRFILPADRDPMFLLEPTSLDLPSYKEIALPFLGWTREQVFAAWIGTDRASAKDGIAPLRRTDKIDKPRYWFRRSYLILDQETTRPNQEPLALVAYLDVGSSNIQDLQYVRCELPITMRLASLLESDIRNLDYVKANVTDENGVVRRQIWENWFKLGGPADKELESRTEEE